MNTGKEKIYGVRFYPDSTEFVKTDIGPIYFHGRITDQVSNFFYIFRCLAPILEGLFVADSFMKNLLDDPHCELARQSFGRHLFLMDEEAQLVILSGDGFLTWGSQRERAFLPIFEQIPSMDVVRQLFWGSDDAIRLGQWPATMRGFMYMSDDFYWDFYSKVPCDIDRLINVHENDKHLKLYAVDISKDYPDPRYTQLTEAKPLNCGSRHSMLPIFREQKFSITDDFPDVTGWVGISEGNIYLGQKTFGFYLGYWMPNGNSPAFVAVTCVDSGLKRIGTIGARLCTSNKLEMQLVSDDKLPWMAGHFDD